MLISIFLFTIAFLGCYDESTWYFVVAEINEISCTERRWIWKDLQTRPIIKLLKHNRCFTVYSRNTIFAWNWEKLIFFCYVFLFWGMHHGMVVIMFNSEKRRDNTCSLVSVCFSIIDTHKDRKNNLFLFVCLSVWPFATITSLLPARTGLKWSFIIALLTN